LYGQPLVAALQCTYINITNWYYVALLKLNIEWGADFRGCESIPKLGKKAHFDNEQSITYIEFFAVFSGFLEYFHSL